MYELENLVILKHNLSAIYAKTTIILTLKIAFEFDLLINIVFAVIQR